MNIASILEPFFRRKVEHTAPWFHSYLRKHIWLTFKSFNTRTQYTQNRQLGAVQLQLAHVKWYKKEDERSQQGNNQLEDSPSSGVIGNLKQSSSDPSNGSHGHQFVGRIQRDCESFHTGTDVSDWHLNEHERLESPPLSLSNFVQDGVARARKWIPYLTNARSSCNTTAFPFTELILIINLPSYKRPMFRKYARACFGLPRSAR